MNARAKQFTQFLFWGAFVVFLAVSIPHIAWVFLQYTPPAATGIIKMFYILLAIGYAIAIDGIMAWLTHAQSTHKEGWRDSFPTWFFISVLVAMSWYLNWVYDTAHDPAGTYNPTSVWGHVLINAFWRFSAITVGGFTPILLGALPVFTIAYVGVLNKVNHAKAQDAKSLAELKKEADEIEQRKELEARIKNAGKKTVVSEEPALADRASQSVIGFINAAKSTQKAIVGEKKEKPNAQQIALQTVVDFYRTTPHLLDDMHAESTNLMIRNLLKCKLNLADAWRIQAANVLKKEEMEAKNQESNPSSFEDEKEESVPTNQDEIDPHQDAISEVNQENIASISFSNDVEMTPIPTSQVESNDTHLDWISQQIYARLAADPELQNELIEQVKMSGISLTAQQLQTRFPRYASYITEDRVNRIYQKFLAEQMPTETTENEPSTDPAQTAISIRNEQDIPEKTTDIDVPYQADIDPISTDDSLNMASISNENNTVNGADNQSDQQTNGVSNQSQMISKIDPNMSAARGPYAMTKIEVAQKFGCQIRDIDAAISVGILKTFAKDSDKVLVSSLQNFVPPKRRKTTAKMTAVLVETTA